MIGEYAIEPEALYEKQTLKLAANLFGFSKGRLISDFPPNWDLEILKYFKKYAKEREFQRITEEILAIKRHIISTGRQFNPQMTWLLNACQEHRRDPFQAIVSKKNPEHWDDIIKPEDLSDVHQKMSTNTTPRFNRNAGEMANLVRPLLKLAKRIIFIDAYFGNLNLRHIRPFLEFIKIMQQRHDKIPYSFIQYHFGDDNNNFLSELLSKIISKHEIKLPIAFYQWPSRLLHNRYILTNLGGIRFGVGLDEDEDGSKPTDEACLLSDETFKQLWNDYYNPAKTPLYSIT